MISIKFNYEIHDKKLLAVIALIRGASSDDRHKTLTHSADSQARGLSSIVLMMLMAEHIKHYMLMNAHDEQD
jgi:hypothetical protein